MLSTTSLLRRSIFFIPPSIMARCASVEVKRSSYITTGISGITFRKPLRAFRWLPIELLWQSHHYQFHRLALHIALKEVDKGVCSHGSESVSHNLQRVGHSDTGSLPPEINCQNSSHFANLHIIPDISHLTPEKNATRARFRGRKMKAATLPSGALPPSLCKK